jgi:hypothetical protein
LNRDALGFTKHHASVIAPFAKRCSGGEPEQFSALYIDGIAQPLHKQADPRNVPALLLACESKRKKPVRQKEGDFHHNVYVVLLSDAVAKHRSILRLNPNRDPLKPCVYVGMTGIPVGHRFENHKNGYKSAWVVRKYGVRLMPELYKHLNPMPFEAAVQMELELAEDLRAAGYTVTGGH